MVKTILLCLGFLQIISAVSITFGARDISNKSNNLGHKINHISSSLDLIKRDISEELYGLKWCLVSLNIILGICAILFLYHSCRNNKYIFKQYPKKGKGCCPGNKGGRSNNQGSLEGVGVHGGLSQGEAVAKPLHGAHGSYHQQL